VKDEHRDLTASMVVTASDEQAVADGCYVDPAQPQHVIDFLLRFACHWQGRWAGQPVELLPWQADDVVLPLYGWRRADGRRRYRTLWLEVPKKNGKTLLAASLGLYGLLGDDEPGAEVLFAATAQKQALLAHDAAERMVKKSPALRSQLKVYTANHRIVDEESGSVARPIARESNLEEGLNWSTIIIDEVHAWKDRRLWDVLEDGAASREQPLRICITTAGDDTSELARELHDYATGILEGTIIDTSFLPVIYAADPEAEWDDVEQWRVANPSLGVTIQEEDLEESARRARVSPAARLNFRRRRLNIWVRQAARWLDLERWDELEVIDPDDLEGERCVAGVDLAYTTDLVARVLVFQIGQVFALLSKFWAPESIALKRQQLNRVRLDAWAAAGHLELTPGDVVDYRKVREQLNEDAERYDLVEVALDPWNATHLATELESEDGIDCVMVRQNMSTLAAPTSRFEELLLEGHLRHDGNPVLRWNVSNVVTTSDPSGNRRPCRKQSREKIDGVAATLTGLARWLLDDIGPSVYEERGPLVFGGERGTLPQ